MSERSPSMESEGLQRRRESSIANNVIMRERIQSMINDMLATGYADGVIVAIRLDDGGTTVQAKSKDGTKKHFHSLPTRVAEMVREWGEPP